MFCDGPEAAPSDHPVIVTCRLGRESLLSEVAEGQGIALQWESASASPASALCSDRFMAALQHAGRELTVTKELLFLRNAY